MSVNEKEDCLPESCIVLNDTPTERPVKPIIGSTEMTENTVDCLAPSPGVSYDHVSKLKASHGVVFINTFTPHWKPAFIQDNLDSFDLSFDQNVRVSIFGTDQRLTLPLADLLPFDSLYAEYSQLDGFCNDESVKKALEYIEERKFKPAKIINSFSDFKMTRDEFMDDLASFMESKKIIFSRPPSLGYKTLDLFILYKAVIKRGGMDEVTQKQEWKAVYGDLNIETMSTSASYNTRTNYKKYLYLYELEHFAPPTRILSADSEGFKFDVEDKVRIQAAGQETVYYAQILKKRFQSKVKAYYVHYNGWSNSHDEWVPEAVLSPLTEEETNMPWSGLTNPPPTRSSKSNHIIAEEYALIEKHYHPRTPKKKSGFYSSKESSPQLSSSPYSSYEEDTSPVRSTKKPKRTPAEQPTNELEYENTIEIGEFSSESDESFDSVHIKMQRTRHLRRKHPQNGSVVMNSFYDGIAEPLNLDPSQIQILQAKKLQSLSIDNLHTSPTPYTEILISHNPSNLNGKSKEKAQLDFNFLKSPQRDRKESQKESAEDPRSLSQIGKSIHTIEVELQNLLNKYREQNEVIEMIRHRGKLSNEFIKKSSKSSLKTKI